MKTLQAWECVLIAAALLVAAAGACFAQAATAATGPVTATVAPSGLIEVSDGSGLLATIDLNAHGPGWDNVTQSMGSGEFTGAAGDKALQVTGTLPVPKTEDGVLDFTESVTALAQGLRIEYDLSAPKTVSLNGLQLSINLPVARYGDGEVMILRPHDDPDIAGLPAEPVEGRTQLWRGDGATIEVGTDTPEAIKVQLRAATDVFIQDLRQWEHDIFEVRFPAIMEDPPREVMAGDRFHLDLTITFAGPFTLKKG